MKSDSIQKQEIIILKEDLIKNYKQIEKLKSSNKNILRFSCLGGTLLFILGLII